MQEQGGPSDRLLELGILPGSNRDFLSEELYGGLLRRHWLVVQIVGRDQCLDKSR